MARQYLQYLNDIRDAVSSIKEITDNQEYEAFKNNKPVVAAVVHYFCRIGEAVTHIPDEVKEGEEGIPWNQIIRLRNILVHRYWAIQRPTLWRIIQNDLNALESRVGEEHLIEEIFARHPDS